MKGVKIREAAEEDAEDLAAIWSCRRVTRETPGLPYASPNRGKKLLEDMNAGDHVLVAEIDGRVVGTLGLRRRTDRLAHVVHLGMAVHDDLQRRGIGAALLEAAIDLTDNWLNLKRVELHVYTDNARAVHLYEKFGFANEGTHAAFAFREGEYVDAYSMARVRILRE